MRTWVKVLLGVLGAIVVLLALNAIVVSNETADAERNVEGADLIETSNGTLQVLDQGKQSGLPIVLIHGYTGSLNWFEELAPLLAADHRVIRVDLLGHGGSDKPSKGYAIADQANAIAEALASLEVTDATIVGHSLGGTVATALAEQSPELAARVVEIDQAPSDDYEHLSLSARAGYTPVIGQAIKRLTDVAPTSMVRAQFEQAFAPGFNVASGFDNPDQVVDDLGEMTYTAFVDVAHAESDYSDSRPLDERLGALGIPLLVIFGAEDQIYDAEAAIEPYEGIDGARTEMIEDVGHSPQVEAPDVVAPLIAAFAATPTPAQQQAKRAAAKRKAAQAKKKAGK